MLCFSVPFSLSCCFCAQLTLPLAGPFALLLTPLVVAVLGVTIRHERGVGSGEVSLAERLLPSRVAGSVRSATGGSLSASHAGGDAVASLLQDEGLSLKQKSALNLQKGERTHEGIRIVGILLLADGAPVSGAHVVGSSESLHLLGAAFVAYSHVS